ncbi:hypothetical protein NW766_000925 [Fusarium irregulare]|uniref:Peptidase S8/S53 domain-containing protein n=1 Tax=Fusarium irregulare TaxID=2494466 RepID=A0A9W8UFT3_9HYPO|nr:hypothetical protein NW766_000925 [Fusarium irregulare]
MTPGGTVSGGGIEERVEWRLINALRYGDHEFGSQKGPAFTNGSAKTREIRNEINQLDFQIRRTFTVLRLDMLQHLESEAEDDLSQDSSESETDSGTDYDSDREDTSSESSSESEPMPLTEEDWETRGDSSSPSTAQALSQLTLLCHVLEARVNPLLIPRQYDKTEDISKFSRLTRLVEHLQHLSSSTITLELIPTSRSSPTQFIFNIAEDEVTATAFVALMTPGQRPDTNTRKRMLAAVRYFSEVLVSFNSFVDMLQISGGSLDTVVPLSPQTLVSNGSPSSFALLHKFRRQTATACRAVLSHFGFCAQNVHKALLQLPEWDDVTTSVAAGESASLPIDLFFAICPGGNWQPARMYLLHLRTLIEHGHFAKEPTLDSMLNNGRIFEIDERKTLAIKLVVGLMLSMESDHVFETWNPKRIHFLDPVESRRLFVSIPKTTCTLSHRKYFSLSSIYPSGSLEEDEEDQKPLPQFALLTKALLQIVHGDRLSKLKLKPSSSQTIWDTINKLRRAVDLYSKRLAYGPEIDRERLSLLHAALGCLNFHMEYQNRLRESQSDHRIEVAWSLVFDTILTKIDSDLTLEKVVASKIDGLKNPYAAQEPLQSAGQAGAQRPSVLTNSSSPDTSTCTDMAEDTFKKQTSIQHGDASGLSVVLFDASYDSTHSTANEFWARLETFHKSCSDYVSSRSRVEESKPPRRIRIAVIDTGIDFNHAGIMEAKEQGRLKEEWCQSWVGGDSSDQDEGLHGTNCAYLLHKAAPEADIFVAKVFNHNTLKFYEAQNIAKAIKYAANTWNVDIISMSFGLRPPKVRDDVDEATQQSARDKYDEIVDEIESAFQDAWPRLIFAAASNSGKNDPRPFPANAGRPVICVHASEGNGEDGRINPEIQSGFNFMTLGMGLELMEKEYFVKKGRACSRLKNVVKSGTSFATPIAAGIAATVLDLASREPTITSRVKRKLKTPEGMERVLRLMSTPKGDQRDRLYYMAPWHHWTSGWEMDESSRRWVWDTITREFVK